MQENSIHAVPAFIDELGRARTLFDGLLRHIEALERRLDYERRRNEALQIACAQKLDADTSRATAH